MLAALRCVDYVIVFDEDDPCRMVEQIQPNLFFKGDDWRDRPMPERAVVERLGGHVVLVPRYRNYSTTSLAQANESLRIVFIGDRLRQLSHSGRSIK